MDLLMKCPKCRENKYSGELVTKLFGNTLRIVGIKLTCLFCGEVKVWEARFEHPYLETKK